LDSHAPSARSRARVRQILSPWQSPVIGSFPRLAARAGTAGVQRGRSHFWQPSAGGSGTTNYHEDTKSTKNAKLGFEKAIFVDFDAFVTS